MKRQTILILILGLFAAGSLLNGCAGEEGSITSVASESTPTLTFREATSNTGFTGRASSGQVVYDGKMWVIGGYDGTNLNNEAWSSDDGITWTQFPADASSDFSERVSAGTVVYNNKIWIIGGIAVDASGDETYLQDVWSFDGTGWTEEATVAGFPARKSPHIFVHNNAIWFIGGKDMSDDVYNDVYTSTDGVTWTGVTVVDPFTAVDHTASLVYNGYMWILGGFNEATNTAIYDTWYSTDGTSWTQGPDLDSDLKGHPYQFNGYLYIVGGFNGLEYNAEIWGSTGSGDWEMQTSDGGFGARYTPAIEFDNRLWLIGGETYDATGDRVYLNDVWYAE